MQTISAEKQNVGTVGALSLLLCKHLSGGKAAQVKHPPHAYAARVEPLQNY